jgi:phenylacetate-CoA ligase
MLETMDFQLPLLKDYIERHHLTRLSIPRTFVLGTYSSGLVHELQRFFSTEIYDRYSPHEVEGVAFACNVHKGMHMAVDSYHIEFLDDRDMPVGPGESGHIIVSDMENYLMPFIRYRIGDVGHYYEEPCTCGRGLPLMGEIDGRARDRFFLKNGATLPPSRIAAVLQDEPGIVLFQAIQDEDGGVTLNIVPKGGLYSPATGERITARLRELIGEVGPISIKPVNSLTLEENGKIQFCKRMGREG